MPALAFLFQTTEEISVLRVKQCALNRISIHINQGSVSYLLRIIQHSNYGSVYCILVLDSGCPSSQQYQLILVDVLWENLHVKQVFSIQNSLPESIFPSKCLSSQCWRNQGDRRQLLRTTSIKDLSTVSLLSVRVPVLSLHRTSIPAISSMAVILFVMAPCSDRRWDPMAIVTDRTVGIAMGIPPMRSTRRLSMPSLYLLCWIGYITTISTSIPIAMEQMQKLPIAVNTW